MICLTWVHPPSYWPVFEAHGLQDLGHKLNDMSKQGQWDDMTKEVSDDVLRLFCAVGRHDEIASVIEARFGGVADTVSCDAGIPADLIQDIERIATRYDYSNR